MNNRTIWLTEEDVLASVSINDVIEALRSATIAEASGNASNLEKSLATWGGTNSMHALGSMMPEAGYVGFKTWAFVPGSGAAVFSLFSSDGELLSVMEAGSIGQLRTASMTGLGTSVLSDPDADEVALIGTGRQAMMQVAAIAAIKPLKRLRVFSRNPDSKTAFVDRARTIFEFDIVAADSCEEAIDGVPIVNLITRATEPFLHGAWLAKGALVNAAGAILPGNAEFHQDVLDRASVVVVDNLRNAMKSSRELIDRFGTTEEGWASVRTLGGMLLNGERRPADADVTIFKPVGMGLSDLAVASMAYNRAVAQSRGVPLPRSLMGEPRWIAAPVEQQRLAAG